MNIEREGFRAAVFKRDKSKCVVPFCRNPPVDAHHIIERALWLDDDELGGYIVDNGVSVCETHHKHAERSFFPPQALRIWAGINHRVLPKRLDPKNFYDKWGKIMRPPNRELVKYPHTPYLNFSPSNDKKDVEDCGFMPNYSMLEKPLIITIKMDGSNVKLTNKIVTARNGHDATHKSFDFLKARHPEFAHKIPDGISVFAEWIYAKHSIHYVDSLALKDLLQVFGVYDANTQLWYGWDDVEKFAEKIGLITVPVVDFRTTGFSKEWEFVNAVTKYGNDAIKKGHEGVVARSASPFHWCQFGDNVAKFVRAGHVTTSSHWSSQPIVKNEVK